MSDKFSEEIAVVSPRRSRPTIVLIYSAIEPVGRRGGGIRNSVLSHAIGLKENNIDVILLTSSEACAQDAEKFGIETHLHKAYDSGISPLFFGEIWGKCRSLRKRKPAAVIHHNGRTWFFANILFPRCRHAQVLHRGKISPYRFFRNWLALNEAYYKQLKTQLSGKVRRIAVTKNGLLAQPVQPQKKVPSHKFSIGTIIRPDKEKATDVLLDAAENLKTQGQDILLVVAGPELEELKEVVRQRSLETHVNVVGWIDDVDSFLDDLDVYCSPSRTEQFGIVLIEAMARGLPVISTATGGPMDIVVDGVTGKLVPIDCAQSLSEAFVAFRSMDHDDLRAMGQNGFDRVVQNYTPIPTGRSVMSALKELGAQL